MLHVVNCKVLTIVYLYIMVFHNMDNDGSRGRSAAFTNLKKNSASLVGKYLHI